MDQLEIPTGALVLIADGRRARLLRNTGSSQRVDLVTEHEFEQSNPPTHQQGSDRPGRVGAPNGVSRSAVRQTDWHRLGEERFAMRIAEVLYRMAHAREFEELVVVAPPKLLGILRTSLHAEVASRVVAEVPKDLTLQPEHELSKLLSEESRA